MIRKVIVASAFLALAPPATSMAQLRSASPFQESDLNVSLRGFSQRVLLDTLAVWKVIPGSPASTFRSVRRILDSLKVPITDADSTQGVIYNRGFVARSKLAGKQVSSSLRCGVGLAGDYADYWRVSIAYAVFVKASGDGSRLGIALAAGANNVEGLSKPAVQCATTGTLEHRIATLVALAAIQ